MTAIRYLHPAHIHVFTSAAQFVHTLKAKGDGYNNNPFDENHPSGRTKAQK